ncbi:MAG: ATPase [Clostridiales bacterium]|nr:ATPase [Clostridiales bacterium]
MSETLELTWEEIRNLPHGSYCLIDIRSAFDTAYGMIPDAVNIPREELEETWKELPADQKMILYCTRGIFSKECAEELRENGAEQVYSLAGGYHGWLVSEKNAEEEKAGGIKDENAPSTDVKSAGEDEEPDVRQKDNEAAADGSEQRQHGERKPNGRSQKALDVEKSIRKRFHKELFSRFAKAIREYELVQENDRIAVCISGGKDSMLMAKLFQELQRHHKFPFELVFLCMDPGYSELNRRMIENNAKILEVPIVFFESSIFEAVYDIEKSPCYLCARMRRGYLYSKAKELGCNKIALGHHYDDVIETILMGMLYGGQVQTMMPKLHSTNFEGMELIRPLYLIREDDIKHWRDYNGLRFIQCACRFTDSCTTCRPDGTGYSKRQEVKQLIAEMKKTNPFVESNIFKSVENVNLNTVIAYKEHGVRHHFLDEYDGYETHDDTEEVPESHGG